MAEVSSKNLKLLKKFNDSGTTEKFIRYYEKLKDDHDTIYYFFKHSEEAFTVHGGTCDRLKETILKNHTLLHLSSRNESLTTLELSFNNMTLCLRKLLLEFGYKVTIFRWDMFGCKPKETVNASPGNLRAVEFYLYEDGDFCSQESTCRVLAISIETGPTIVMAYVDQHMREAKYIQFGDTAQLNRLEATILQIGPKEILLSSKCLAMESIKNLLKRTTIPVSKVNVDALGKDNLGNLSYLFREKASFETLQHDQPLVHKILAVAFNYLRVLDSEDSVDTYTLEPYDDSKFVSISVDTKLCTGVFSAYNESYGRQKPGLGNKSKDYTTTKRHVNIGGAMAESETSLFDILDHTVTKSGKRLLFDWVQTPLKDVRLIKERQRLVATFHENPSLAANAASALKCLPDLARTALRIQKSPLKSILKNIFEAKTGIDAIPRLINSFSDIFEACEDGESGCSEDAKVLLNKSVVEPLADIRKELETFLEMVDSCIDYVYLQEAHDYRVSYEMCEELKEQADQINQIIARAKKWFRKQACATAGEKAGIELRFDNSAITIRATKRARSLQSKLLNVKDSNKVPILNEISSKNNEHRFSSDKLDELTQEYRDCIEQYNDIQKDQLFEIAKLSKDYTDLMFSASRVVSELDCLMSLAMAAQHSSSSYVMPVFDESPTATYNILGARHPVLDVVLTSGVIPNNIVLQPGEKMCIITGPNMGGKSTYIKTVALLSVMAQIGSMIPADECVSMPILDKLLARIGANDKPQHGISTFMAEMIDTSNILRSSTGQSLVIIDELGRGTSTFDGFGLASAVACELVERGAICFQATHFHEMNRIKTMYPDNVCMKCVGVVEDEETKQVVFTFTLEDGVSNGSYGIHCAKLAGIPEEVVARAEFNAENLDCISRAVQKIDPAKIDLLEELLEKKDKAAIITALGDTANILKISC